MLLLDFVFIRNWCSSLSAKWAQIIKKNIDSGQNLQQWCQNPGKLVHHFKCESDTNKHLICVLELNNWIFSLKLKSNMMKKTADSDNSFEKKRFLLKWLKTNVFHLFVWNVFAANTRAVITSGILRSSEVLQVKKNIFFSLNVSLFQNEQKGHQQMFVMKSLIIQCAKRFAWFKSNRHFLFRFAFFCLNPAGFDQNQPLQSEHVTTCDSFTEPGQKFDASFRSGAKEAQSWNVASLNKSNIFCTWAENLLGAERLFISCIRTTHQTPNETAAPWKTCSHRWSCSQSHRS